MKEENEIQINHLQSIKQQQKQIEEIINQADKQKVISESQKQSYFIKKFNSCLLLYLLKNCHDIKIILPNEP